MSNTFSLHFSPPSILKQKRNNAIELSVNREDIAVLTELFRAETLAGRALRLLYDYALHNVSGRREDLELLLAISIARARARRKP